MSVASETTQAAPTQERASETTSTTSSGTPDRSRGVQLKRQLQGKSYDEQMAALSPAEPVQADTGGGGDAGSVHQAAAHGIKGGGGALPHGDTIQKAFGNHDVSGVKAHVGGNAAEASKAMGANAYATGNHIAFANQPDLHTAAHEAAHTIQQRAGVSLSGGVGKAGDSYEQHADKVADAVVAGKNAAPILDQMTGGGGGAAATQKKDVQQQAVQRDDATTTPAGPPPKPTTPAEYKAQKGWGPFSDNLKAFGFTEGEALTAWRKAIDQLYANLATYERIKDDEAAVLRYIDAAASRSGFNEMAQLLLQKKPLDTTKKYAFWSGKPSHEYANSRGYEVLESVALGNVFNNVRLVFREWNVMKTLWRAISNVYAGEIAKIMGAGKIHCFQRKWGEIYAEVESLRVAEVLDDAGLGAPNYVFHPLLVDGCFGEDGTFEKTYSNGTWREKLTAAADGDGAKAKAKAESKGLKVFDYTGTVPLGALQDSNVTTSSPAAKAVIDGQHARLLIAARAAERELKAEAAPSGAGTRSGR